ncbi:MAG: ribonuclease P protein component [Clostridia bacterium]|nr:ribonuclease P protein component [Clostridia bacterium]
MKFTAITENHLYSKAYSKGKRAVTSALAVYILPDYAAKRLAKAHPQKITVNRIGLTTSKALGGAVIRSRCRRLIREAMRLVIKERPMKVGFLIVIAARHGIIPLKCDEVKRQLEYALGKLDMFKKGQDV